MVGWSNNFGLIESGNSDIDFVSIGLADESQRAATRCAERADTPSPCDFTRFSPGKLKIVPPKRSPCYDGRTGTLATIFAMAMSDVVGLAGALVSHSTAQTTAANHVSLRFHIDCAATAQFLTSLVGRVRANRTPPTGSLPGKLALL
jgi:hypothetical protein